MYHNTKPAFAMQKCNIFILLKSLQKLSVMVDIFVSDISKQAKIRACAERERERERERENSLYHCVLILLILNFFQNNKYPYFILPRKKPLVGARGEFLHNSILSFTPQSSVRREEDSRICFSFVIPDKRKHCCIAGFEKGGGDM